MPTMSGFWIGWLYRVYWQKKLPIPVGISLPIMYHSGILDKVVDCQTVSALCTEVTSAIHICTFKDHRERVTGPIYIFLATILFYFILFYFFSKYIYFSTISISNTLYFISTIKKLLKYGMSRFFFAYPGYI